MYGMFISNKDYYSIIIITIIINFTVVVMFIIITIMKGIINIVYFLVAWIILFLSFV